MSREDETFLLLPLAVNSDLNISVTPSQSLPPNLATEIAALNALHQTLLTSETTSPPAAGNIPPPPVPVNPKRSAAIAKLRTSGNDAYKKKQFGEAVRIYSLGIEMALGRPNWEPSGLVKDELYLLYANRSQAYMATGQWPEGLADSDASVDCKKVGNPKAHWRKGKCLKEMGRLEEAREALELGLEFGGEDADLKALYKEVEDALGRRT
ncbi:hypothetical protein DFH27DRAFT_548091 [Peziza echinospora]|nr:hypothetical protein DFH27DRAFT_548091 [Peziza echinospora]